MEKIAAHVSLSISRARLPMYLDGLITMDLVHCARLLERNIRMCDMGPGLRRVIIKSRRFTWRRFLFDILHWETNRFKFGADATLDAKDNYY